MVALRQLRLQLAALALQRGAEWPGRWRLHRFALKEARRIGPTMSPRRIRTRDGFEIDCDLKEWIGQYVYVSGGYEEASVALVSQLVRPGDLVVDAGANIGYFSLVFSRLAGASGRVLAFEPMPHARHALSANLRLNNVSNVDVRAVALSDQTGTRQFYLGPDDHTSNSSLVPKRDARVIEVQCARLDDFFSAGDRVRLLKIDVEGAEASVLGGARTLIASGLPHIIAEVSSPEWPRSLIDAGYAMYGVGWKGIQRIRDPQDRALPSQYNAWFTREPIPPGVHVASA